MRTESPSGAGRVDFDPACVRQAILTLERTRREMEQFIRESERGAKAADVITCWTKRRAMKRDRWFCERPRKARAHGAG